VLISHLHAHNTVPTTGIPAFKSIMELMPKSVGVILDVGGGKFDVSKRYVEKQYSERFQRKVTMHVIDPYNRSMEHNARVQKIIEERGGADVVTSISVLNVIPTHETRVEHVRVVHKALKKQGLAMFKVWAGSWPLRGTKKPSTNKARGCFQANTWASDFVSTIREVFGDDSPIYACNIANLIVARKISASEKL
jgi:hypothetical protein